MESPLFGPDLLTGHEPSRTRDDDEDDGRDPIGGQSARGSIREPGELQQIVVRIQRLRST